MKSTVRMTVAAPAAPGSSAVDSNRFYSMLLDARSANISVTENMYDVSEKLLRGEKDNAKLALDQLWALKKSLTDDQTDETIDRMISYYQEKINALREKEENIKKVGKETRALVDSKKKRDEELALVKTQIGECTRELRDLKQKLETLSKREQELAAAERKLKKEIGVNESLIVNGLYDIILRRPDSVLKSDPLKDGGAEESGADSDEVARELAEFGIDTSMVHKKALAEQIEKEAEAEALANLVRKEADESETLNREEEADAAVPVRAPAQTSRPAPIHEPVVYPKSVVRMSGKVIGEYYHDGNAVAKEKRHYIYNSRFMAERLLAAMRSVKARFNSELRAEAVKLVDDAANRVRDNARFHFEVSTNEILNDKNLKQVAADLKRGAWDDAERFAVRLAAKIEALGANYEAMLQEQMERCAEKD